MTEPLGSWLKEWKNNALSLTELEKNIREYYGFTEINHLCWDDNRIQRQGFPEVVLASGKTQEQLTELLSHAMDQRKPLLLTRLSKEMGEYLHTLAPQAKWDEIGRVFAYGYCSHQTTRSFVAVVTAGAADESVAREAVATLEFLGIPVKTYYDRGVAGVHRLLAIYQELKEAQVCIAIAGMEGALPTVISGLISAPVIGVPTSAGYGVAQDGMTALFGMLTSCADKVAVVNIDNGYGAARVAAAICREKDPS